MSVLLHEQYSLAICQHEKQSTENIQNIIIKHENDLFMLRENSRFYFC